VSGIGEGPRLARALLARGWRLRVSVVGEAAGRAYAPHPALELQVGALAGPGAIATALVEARCQGGFRWVVDGTHPFAERISADLLSACQRLDQPLLRLQRPPVAVPSQGTSTVPLENWGDGGALALGPGGLPRRQVLNSLQDLAALDLGGKRLLLAIGARRLREALAHSPAHSHFARILPNPTALALARAAGLADGQLACLHPRPGLPPSLPASPPGSGPGGIRAAGEGPAPELGPPRPGAIERALCRRWAIDAVLCRQSGGVTEQLWSDLCVELGLELLLLRQPQASSQVAGLEFSALLATLGHPGGLPQP
jgi:precorrin-6A/cobalt-precorrin-6A reductase